MKLKKADTPDINDIPDMSESSGPVIPDRLKLDAPAPKTSGAGRVAALIAFLASLAAMALVGATAAMMYVNWGSIAEM